MVRAVWCGGGSPRRRRRTTAGGLRPGRSHASGYDWSIYDRLVERARARGPEGDDHARSRHPGLGIGGAVGVPALHRRVPRPGPVLPLAPEPAHVLPVRQGGRAALRRAAWRCGRCTTSPTSSTTCTRSSRARGRGKFVDLAAVRYRRLWYEGWKAIAQYDPANRDRVLFGETAAISSPHGHALRGAVPGRERQALPGPDEAPARVHAAAAAADRRHRPPPVQQTSGAAASSPSRSPRTPCPLAYISRLRRLCGRRSGAGGSRAGAAST